MAKRKKDKFDFGTDFQELILQYTVTNPKGFKVLELYKDSYFTLEHHAIIAMGLADYYKRRKRIPEPPLLKETLRNLYEKSPATFVTLKEEDKTLISTTIDRLYMNRVGDEETVVERCIEFAKYIRFKEELEKVDITKFSSFAASINGFNEVNKVGLDLDEDYGTYLIGGMTDRAHKRDTLNAVNPTPIDQLNNYLNSGGLTPGSLVFLMSKQKKFKTATLINIAKGYLRKKKKLLYLDLENGERAITTRSEQSVIGETQQVVNSGDVDNKLMKVLRKYRRLGAELVIKRFNAGSTTADFQKFVEKSKQDKGIVFTDVFIDYIPIMGSLSGTKEEFNRISEATLDVKNWAEENKFESVWSAVHVTRDGDKKRTGTRYEATDIAKCIDITRHIDLLLGLQQSEEEHENKMVRIEVIEGRNVEPNGRALFWADMPKQRMKEFTKAEAREYNNQMHGDEPAPKTVKKSPEKKSDL